MNIKPQTSPVTWREYKLWQRLRFQKERAEAAEQKVKELEEKVNRQRLALISL